MASTVSYIIIIKIDASKTPHKAYQKTHITTIIHTNKQYTIKGTKYWLNEANFTMHVTCIY